jgi:hypothetical protein
MENRREGGQDGIHAITVEIDFRPQVLMAILLNEALRPSVPSTEACRTDGWNPSSLGHRQRLHSLLFSPDVLDFDDPAIANRQGF